MTDDLRATPLLEEHRKLGARLVPFAGYQMPIQYEGIVAEHQAVRERVGLFDVSHMGELVVRGDSALSAVNRLITNDLARIEDGQALYTCCCNEAGRILDDLIVYRRSANDVLVVCNASNRKKIASHFRRELSEVEFEDQSDHFALIAVQGPRALETLTRAGYAADKLRPFRFGEGSIGGADVTAARTGYTGEDGAELFVKTSDATRVWQELLKAGAQFDVKAAGLGARDTLRLEARLSLYGNDITEETDPIEAGLGWTVKLDKQEFIGQAALQKIKADGPPRKMVGFEMTGRGIARHGYPIVDAAGEIIGTCTSGGPSPTLKKNIGLGYVPSELSAVGSEILIDCRGKAVPAVVVKTPFYKRPRAS